MHKPSSSAPLKRPIQAKHLILLSLGGAIGTGLFLGSGEVIHQAGALGAILAYIFGASVTYAVMMCLGELAAYMPVSNAFGAYATRLIGPATGYMIAWVYWLTWSLTLGVDFTAAAILLNELLPEMPVWLGVMLFTGVVLLLNLYSTRLFAESEFYLSLVKVATVVLFIVLGLLVLFHFISVTPAVPYPDYYINNFSKENLFPYGIKGLFNTMLLVSFSFTGTELIAVAAGEAQNPKESVPKAIKATFWRLLIMFIGTITLIAFLFPQGQLGLASAEAVSSSPFVLLLGQLKVPYAENGIRLVIIVALLSSASAGLYGGSRMLWAISEEHGLPQWVGKVNQRGIPVSTVIITILGGLPGLFLKYFSMDKVLTTIIDISAFTMIVVWASVCIAQFNFRRRFLLENKSLDSLPYRSPFYPYLSIIGCLGLFITAFSMLMAPSRLISFALCLLFILGCYLRYYQKTAKAK
ncbi:MAG: amino acid permease [Neisseriaceae bacterium]